MLKLLLIVFGLYCRNKSLVNTEILPTLEIVVSLLHVCSSLMDKGPNAETRLNVDQKGLLQIVQNLPYEVIQTVRDKSGRKAKTTPKASEGSSFNLNISVCHLFCDFAEMSSLKHETGLVIGFLSGKGDLKRK